MKIKAPLSNKSEVKPLLEAGADELFCGIEPSFWREKYKNFCINQRSTGANFTKFGDLEKAISTAHRYRARVHIAINGFFYLEKQYKTAARIIRDVFNLGADGIILADPGLFPCLRDKGYANKDIIVGCDSAIFNSAAVQIYKDLGATRVVFPRGMTINEISAVVTKDKMIEYEVFIINDLCFFIDAFCAYCKEQSGKLTQEAKSRRNICFFTTSHLPGRGYRGGCRALFKEKRIPIRGGRTIKSRNKFTFWGGKHIDGCGACAIYDFKKIGITSLKVLDRNLPQEGKVRSTAFINKCAGFLEKRDICKMDYIKKCKILFKKTFKAKCNKYDCYYPSCFLEY